MTGGLVTVVHTCVNTQTIHSGCSSHNQVSETVVSGDGSFVTKFLSQLSLINATYIMSAKYPMYYLTGDDCSWRVRIPPHQSLLVRVLDLQLRGNSGIGQQ